MVMILHRPSLLSHTRALFFCALTVAGCDGGGGGGDGTEVGGSPGGETPPPQPPPSSSTIEIKGSDSEVNLVQRMAEVFMQSHPEVKIAVTGGGSGAGIAALLDGTATLANSSRPLEGQEKVQASRNKVSPVETIFATDALSVVVHKDNPVTSLTVDQVGQLFSGDLATWESLGGTGAVNAYGRQSSSGTYSFFRDVVVKKDYSSGVREMNGNAQIVEAVGADPSGVGYVAVGYVKSAADRVKIVPIAPSAAAPAVNPLDEAAVLQGSYPISRPLYQFTNGQPTGALKEFLQFELSEQGRAITVEMGFYPVMDAWKDKNSHLQGG